MSESKRDKENRWKKRQSSFRKRQKQIRKTKTYSFNPKAHTSQILTALLFSLGFFVFSFFSSPHNPTKNKKDQTFLLGFKEKSNLASGFRVLGTDI